MKRLAVLLGLTAILAGGCQLLPFLGGPGGSPVPQVTTAEQAAALVLAQDARFKDIARRDPDLIGQGSWWEVTATQSGYEVTVQIGWDDCPAGCINRHTWVYAVSGDGTVTRVSEAGDPIPGEGTGNVGGRVVAGPVCPVETVPPDPACAPRPVAGATLTIGDAQGKDVAVVVSDANGLFALTLPPGDYVLIAQPVEGLMGTPEPLSFAVLAGSPVELTVAYDTGIR